MLVVFKQQVDWSVIDSEPVGTRSPKNINDDYIVAPYTSITVPRISAINPRFRVVRPIRSTVLPPAQTITPDTKR